MKKKEMLFDEEIFDEKVYTETKQKYEDMAERLPDLLASLAAEGLPTDWSFVDDITCNESAFREWVNMQKEERHKGKFLTINELERLSEELDDFYDRVIPSVNAIRRMRIERLPLSDASGLITVDMDKVEEIARKVATTRINATKMQAYWEQVSKLVQAINDLREYEERNGLPDSTFNPASIYTRLQGVYVPSNLSTTEFRDKFSTPEKFQNIFLNQFKRK
jgi:hypothetical protein